jgi:taurine dioxygenase
MLAGYATGRGATVTNVSVRQLTAEFGAEIRGVDLRAPLDEEDRHELREVFDERGILVFRDVDVDVRVQQHVSDMLIGLVDDDADAAGSETRKESYISNKEEGGIAPFGRLLWHSDMMWSDQPPQALSLHGVHVEQPSVPTLFASATRARDALSEDLRVRIDGLHAVHVTGQVDRGRYEEGEVLKPIRTEEQSTTIPIVQAHPRTGREILYVCEQCTKEIVELPHDESEALLEELFAAIYDPSHTLEHEWRRGDLVIWDNLAIQHGRADVRTEGPARTLRKTFSPRVQGHLPETPRFSRTA